MAQKVSRQRYESRPEMVRDVRARTAEGWMVEVITVLAEGSYEVVFVEARRGMAPQHGRST